MLISIVIALNNIAITNFNKIKYSLLVQTLGFENLEIIFIDTGLTDDFCEKVLTKFVDENNNVKLYKKNNHYNTENLMNFGLNHVEQDYVIFLNSEDIFHESACELLYESIHSNNADIAIGYYNPSNNKFMPENIVINNFTEDYNIINMKFTLSYRIYKTDFIKELVLNQFKTSDNFNILTLTEANGICLVHNNIFNQDCQQDNDKIINSKKINVLSKINKKEFNDLNIVIKSSNNEKKDYSKIEQLLKKSIEQIGFKVNIYKDSNWNNETNDLTIVFSGSDEEYAPHPSNINILLDLYQHDNCLEEFNKYDLVLTSSYCSNDEINSMSTIVKPFKNKLLLNDENITNKIVDELMILLNKMAPINFIEKINITTTENNPNKYNTPLRVIILDYDNSKYLIESIDAINYISNNIPISILHLNGLNYNKFSLEDKCNFKIKKIFFEKINSLIKELEEDFIFIIHSGDIITKEGINKFSDIYKTKDISKIGAIIFDDMMIKGKPNLKMGFSPDLYLEHDYIHNSVIINTNVIINQKGFDSHLPNNFIRYSILKMYQQGYSIIKEDVIGLKINNYLSPNFQNEIELFYKKILNNVKYSIIKNIPQNSYSIKYDTQHKKASIIIPFKDEVSVTRVCVDSILKKTNYDNYELILVNNNSNKKETFEFIKEMSNISNCKVINYDFGFNWSAINNFASKQAEGDILVFLNNDTEVISSNWLELLIGDAIQPGVAAVGAMLYYPDNTVQHAGVVMGLTHLAGHVFSKKDENLIPQIYRNHRRNASAVTGACVAFEKSVFKDICGFNEDFEVAFSDVEICLRALEMGYRNVFNPNCKLYHHEMKTRGRNFRTIDRIIAYDYFVNYLKKGDPFFNDQFSLNYRHPRVKPQDEIPAHENFWSDFTNERKKYLDSMHKSKENAKVSNEKNLIYSNISKKDIVANNFLIRTYFKNPENKLKEVLWFLPNFNNINESEAYAILKFSELLSIHEKTINSFIFYENDFNKEHFYKNIEKWFPNLNFNILNLKKVFELKYNKFDVAFCTDIYSAHLLLKFNNCKSKIYFNQGLTNNYETNILNEQIFNFNFPCITNSTSIYNQYKQKDCLVYYFYPFINQDIYFPLPHEKQEKINISFILDENKKFEFDLGINVIKILKEYFNDEINIMLVGSKLDLNQLGLSDIKIHSPPTPIELSNIFKKSDVSFIFSNNEIPFQILNCMACGCVVLTNFNENKKLLKYKHNIMLTEALENCIVEDLIDLINDTKLRNTIINNGLITIEQINNNNNFLKIIEFIKNPIPYL